MIRVPLPDGRTARFPAGTPAEAIEQAIGDYLEEIAPAPTVAAVPAANMTAELEIPPEPFLLEASLPPLPIVVPPRIRLEPYRADDDSGAGDLRLPEVAPAGGVCREVLERSRLRNPAWRR